MARRTLVAAALLAGALSACASTTKTPVGDDFRTTYAVDDITVRLSKGDKIPNRYDASVAKLIQDRNTSPLTIGDVRHFRAYAEEHGGVDSASIGERFLEFLIWRELRTRIPDDYVGEQSAAMVVEITDTTFPNTATMLMGGERTKVRYIFALKDAARRDLLVASAKELKPMVTPTSAVDGGLVGPALRADGAKQHLEDLERVAAAVADSLETWLTHNQPPRKARRLIKAYPHNIAAGPNTAAVEAVAVLDTPTPAALSRERG